MMLREAHARPANIFDHPELYAMLCEQVVILRVRLAVDAILLKMEEAARYGRQ